MCILLCRSIPQYPTRALTPKLNGPHGWSGVAFLMHKYSAATKWRKPGHWAFSVPSDNRMASGRNLVRNPKAPPELRDLLGTTVVCQGSGRAWLWDSWHRPPSPFGLQCTQCRLCCNHPAGPDGGP